MQAFGPNGPTPDMEFSCFSAFYAPAGGEFEGEALLCVRVGSGRGSHLGRAAPLLLHATTISQVET